MTSPTVSLVLGSGGARGYAHIGAIEELLAQGYDIRCIAGSSMGALIGGVYAAGKLDAYRDWAIALQRFDVLRLLDWTFTGGGLIKGDRIIHKLRELIGEMNIEDLPLAYTAVAVDLITQREVWFSRGSLFDAIRASIAIPTVFRPHYYEGRTFVDGGLLNPVPITPTLRDLTDCTIAVDVNASAESPDGDPTGEFPLEANGHYPSSGILGARWARTVKSSVEAAEPIALATAADAVQRPVYRRRITGFLARMRGLRGKKSAQESVYGIVELFARSLDMVQETITRFRLAAQPPDLVIGIPRNACALYEFHRAEEMIELGRLRTREALNHYRPTHKN